MGSTYLQPSKVSSKRERWHVSPLPGPLVNSVLRAASPTYQLDLEIAKKSNYSKLTQNEASPTATNYKNIVLSSINQKNFLRHFFVSMPQIGQNLSKMSGIFRGS